MPDERTPHLDEVRPLVQLVSPFAPHIAEELWSVLGETRSIFDSGWPSYDEALVVEDLVTMAVQVNGKTRGTITVSKTASQDEAVAAAMAEANVAKFVSGPVEAGDLRAAADVEFGRLSRVGSGG